MTTTIDPHGEWFDFRVYKQGVLAPHLDRTDRNGVIMTDECHSKMPATITRIEESFEKQGRRLPVLWVEYEWPDGSRHERGPVPHRDARPPEHGCYYELGL